MSTYFYRVCFRSIEFPRGMAVKTAVKTNLTFMFSDKPNFCLTGTLISKICIYICSGKNLEESLYASHSYMQKKQR